MLARSLGVERDLVKVVAGTAVVVVLHCLRGDADGLRRGVVLLGVGLVDVADQRRDEDGREDGEDDEHDDELDEREAALLLFEVLEHLFHDLPLSNVAPEETLHVASCNERRTGFTRNVSNYRSRDKNGNKKLQLNRPKLAHFARRYDAIAARRPVV